jgi:hypothetical protein
VLPRSDVGVAGPHGAKIQGRTSVRPPVTPGPAVGLAGGRSWPTGMWDMPGMQEQFLTSAPGMAAIPGGQKSDLRLGAQGIWMASIRRQCR